MSIARQGPANHDVKSGVVVDCMAWMTPPMAQEEKPPIPSEIECPSQLTTSWPRPPRGLKIENPIIVSAHRRAEVEGPRDEEDGRADDDRPGRARRGSCVGRPTYG